MRARGVRVFANLVRSVGPVCGSGPGVFFFWNHFRLSNIPLRYKVQRFASYAEDLLLEGRGSSLLDVKTIDAMSN